MPIKNSSDFSQHHGLDELLGQLRSKGVPVGVMEMQRLNAVFSKSPKLNRNDLKDILVTVLAKDEQQRQIVHRLFDRLVSYDFESSQANQLGSAQIQQRSKPADQQAQVKSKDIRPTKEAPLGLVQSLINFLSYPDPNKVAISSVIMLGLLCCLLITGAILGSKDPPGNTPTPTGFEEIRKVERPTTKSPEVKKNNPLGLVRTIDYWSPTVEIKPTPVLERLLPWLLLLLGSGIGFSGLLYKAMVTTRRERPKRPDVHRGEGRFHIPHVVKKS